jgi:hypothetical protein
MPQVESFRLDVPNGHAFPGWEPGCAATTHPRLSITPRHWYSWSRPRHCLAFLKRKQQDDFASPFTVRMGTWIFPRLLTRSSPTGSSTMLRITRLRSCRLSSLGQFQRMAYSVSSMSEAEAFLMPAGSSYPGVTFLSLNRPKTKNAISVNLLQVWFPQSRSSITRFTSHSDFGTV